MAELSSEGFDLDATGEGPGDIVFEIGGGATVVPGEGEASQSPTVPETPASQLEEAEKYKQLGNEEFKMKNYLEAYDMYTKAIETCPCSVKPEEILRQRDEFDAMEREKARSRLEKETEQRKRGTKTTPSEEISSGKTTTESNESESPKGPATFALEPQENGEKLAIFLNNRAASLIQLQRFEEAIKDADVAILLNPRYTKAYIRRSSAYEKIEQTSEALTDIKRALELEPSNRTIRKSAARLQKIEDERLNKLKVRRANFFVS